MTPTIAAASPLSVPPTPAEHYERQVLRAVPRLPRLTLPHPAVSSLLLGMARQGYPVAGYEVVTRSEERISLHARVEDALGAAEDLWGPCEQTDEWDGAVSFHGSEFDGEDVVGITFGFVREARS